MPAITGPLWSAFEEQHVEDDGGGSDGSQALLHAHGLHPNEMQGWRCIPMKELDPKGPEIAQRTGAAAVGLKSTPDGGIALHIPSVPPVFGPFRHPPGLKCPRRRSCVGAHAKLLEDPAGIEYWVVTSKKGNTHENQELDWGPVEQPKSEQLVCAPGKLENAAPEPVYTPGLKALPRFLRGAGFLGTDLFRGLQRPPQIPSDQ